MPYYREDPDMAKYLSRDGAPLPHIRERDGVLWLDERILVPAARVPDVLAAYHNDGHWGRSKTVDLVNRRYLVPRIWPRVSDFVSRCVHCARVKPGVTKSSVKHMPVPVQKWHTVHLDWIEGLPAKTAARYDSILTIVDSATRMVHLVPTRKDSTSAQTAEQLVKHLFRLHGFPRVLRTDRDRRVTSQLWLDVCSLLGVKPTPTVAFHPRANGAVERVNGLITTQLRLHALNSPNWVAALPAIEMAINSRSLSNSVYSPFYLNYGFHPTTVADAMLGVSDTGTTEEAKTFVRRLRSDFDSFRVGLQSVDDGILCEPRFKVGDFVFVRFSHRPDPTHGHTGKHLRIPWHGPFQVTHVVSDVTFRIALPPGYEVHDVFHVRDLRAHGGAPPSQGRKSAETSRQSKRKRSRPDPPRDSEDTEHAPLYTDSSPAGSGDETGSAPVSEDVSASERRVRRRSSYRPSHRLRRPLPASSDYVHVDETDQSGESRISEARSSEDHVDVPDLSAEVSASESLNPDTFAAEDGASWVAPDVSTPLPQPTPEPSRRILRHAKPRRGYRPYPARKVTRPVNCGDLAGSSAHQSSGRPVRHTHRPDYYSSSTSVNGVAVCAPSSRSNVRLHPEDLHRALQALHYDPLVDAFADAELKQFPRYWSRDVTDKHAAAHDAFAQKWSTDQRLYINPPYHLLDRVLTKIIDERVRCVVVAPLWRFAPWFEKLRALRVDAWRLPTQCYVYRDDTPRPRPPWHTVVVVVDGTRCA
jgi:hypothetical protein